MDTFASPAPLPYGSILSVTWVGLDATLFPTTSMYFTVGRTSRSSAWTVSLGTCAWGECDAVCLV